MSFLSSVGHVFQHIGQGVTVASGIATTIDNSPIGQIVEATPIGGIFGTILHSIIAAEKIIPQAGAGTAKKAATTALVNGAVPGIDPATLSASIDTLVQLLNTLSVPKAVPAK